MGTIWDWKKRVHHRSRTREYTITSILRFTLAHDKVHHIIYNGNFGNK